MCRPIPATAQPIPGRGLKASSSAKMRFISAAICSVAPAEFFLNGLEPLADASRYRVALFGSESAANAPAQDRIRYLLNFVQIRAINFRVCRNFRCRIFRWHGFIAFVEATTPPPPQDLNGLPAPVLWRPFIFLAATKRNLMAQGGK
jgi:hypothetical protein